jgi:tRNA threonylcarbamoyl adenosine modification protein YjeE
MPDAHQIADLTITGEAAMSRLGADLARAAKAGDLILLEGDLGAGKSTLARAFIRAFHDTPDLDVPSPTYTLVQHYDGPVPVLHVDLYRTRSAAESDELGLSEALETGIVLVEWPQRAPYLYDEAHLTVRITGIGESRRIVLSATQSAAPRFARTLAIRAFLARHNHERSMRTLLAGDASSRSYESIHPNQNTARNTAENTAENTPALLLMNAPKMADGPPIHDGLPYSRIAHLAESVTPFVAIDQALIAAGFCAPLIHAHDLDQGLLLIEDLGRDGILDDQGRPVAERYQAAAALLADLHRVDLPLSIQLGDGISHEVPAYSCRAMLVETELFIDWYWPEMRGAPAPDSAKAEWFQAWNEVLDSIGSTENALVLRDYHSPNIIWRQAKTGTDQIGLIDFQDAVFGPSAYDVASLARDARVDMSEQLEASVVAAYCARRHQLGAFDQAAFTKAFAIMAAQRNAKILGIFHRLNRRDNKPAYLKHLPRIEHYFGRSLAEPAMAPVAAMLKRHGLSFPGWQQ